MSPRHHHAIIQQELELEKLIQGLAGAVGWCPRASAEQGGSDGRDSGGEEMT